MIDTHCHLDYLEHPELEPPLLTALVCIGANVQHARASIALAERFGNVYATVGLHPTDTLEDSPQTRAELEGLLSHPKVVGVGESGLDYYWDAAPKEVQVSAFEWQLEQARARNLPIVIHTRDKQNEESCSLDCAETLENANWSRGILHCCNGHRKLIETGLELGFYVSFAGNLTYKNATVIQDAARWVPLERLLVETDAPFLAPVPQRGKSNFPHLVRHTLEFLAGLCGTSFEEMERVTDENARACYGI